MHQPLCAFEFFENKLKTLLFLSLSRIRLMYTYADTQVHTYINTR